MLKGLLESLSGAMNPSPFQGFMAQLWQEWTRDVTRAVLLARWYWQHLPADLAQHAARIQQQGQAAVEQIRIDRQVNAELGAMGIFPSPTPSGLGFGLGPNPAQAVFVAVMATIQAHGGDPPVTDDAVGTAEAVLHGQLDPIDALMSAAPPQVHQQLVLARQAMQLVGGFDILRVQAFVSAASALPRERISVFLPEAR